MINERQIPSFFLLRIDTSRVSGDLNRASFVVKEAKELSAIGPQSHVVPLTLCPESVVHSYQVEQHLVDIGQKLRVLCHGIIQRQGG